MATYDLEEQEQLDELKTWWKMNSRSVIAIVVALLTFVATWQGWGWWLKTQAIEASTLYAGIQQAHAQRDTKRVRELAGELTDKYSGTAYAGMGALLSARIQLEAGDAKTARLQLAWATENAKDEAVRELARLRLIAVLLDEKAHDEAQKQLAAEPLPAFAARHAELKGDLLATQGKTAEARAAYQNALARFDASVKAAGPLPGAFREMLQVKLESLGAAK